MSLSFTQEDKKTNLPVKRKIKMNTKNKGKYHSTLNKYQILPYGSQKVV